MAAPGGKWQVFEPDTPVLTYTYSFGLGVSNALAVGTPGGLFVMSPPYRTDAAAFDELGRYGPVSALIATNAFHHKGLPEWKRRYPDAAVYAPSQSLRRVARKAGLEGVRPLDETQALAGARLALVDMPHYRTGEVLARLETTRGAAWYVTDLISNLPALPRNPLFRLIYGASGSAPGLKFNNFAALFMVRDKRALKRWLADEYGRAPPRWIIPAHGEVADLASAGAAVHALFEP